MKNFLLEALGVLSACQTAQWVLGGGYIVSIVLVLIGADLAENIHPARSAFHEQIQMIAVCLVFLSAIFALVASCVLAYNACQKHIEKHT